MATGDIILPQTAYKKEQLTELWNKSEKGENVVEYIQSYAFKISNPTGYLMWKPDLMKFEHFQDNEFFRNYVPDLVKFINVPGTKEKIKLRSLLEDKMILHTQDVDLHEKIVYNIKGQNM